MYVTLRDNTAAVKEALQDALLRGLKGCGLAAEGYAKGRCPVDTGRLRASIGHALDEEGLTVYVGTNVQYAPHVELGTHRQRAQPYLRPAVARHMSVYRAILKQALTGQG